MPFRRVVATTDGPLVVMLIFSLTFSFEPFITFCISLIFLLGRLGNVFLIFNVSLVMFFGMAVFVWMDGEVVFTYDFFCWKLVFLKYLDNLMTSFCNLAGIRGGIEKMKVGSTTSLPLLLFANLGT